MKFERILFITISIAFLLQFAACTEPAQASSSGSVEIEQKPVSAQPSAQIEEREVTPVHVAEETSPVGRSKKSTGESHDSSSSDSSSTPHDASTATKDQNEDHSINDSKDTDTGSQGNKDATVHTAPTGTTLSGVNTATADDTTTTATPDNTATADGTTTTESPDNTTDANQTTTESNVVSDVLESGASKIFNISYRESITVPLAYPAPGALVVSLAQCSGKSTFQVVSTTEQTGSSEPLVNSTYIDDDHFELFTRSIPVNETEGGKVYLIANSTSKLNNTRVSIRTNFFTGNSTSPAEIFKVSSNSIVNWVLNKTANIVNGTWPALEIAKITYDDLVKGFTKDEKLTINYTVFLSPSKHSLREAAFCGLPTDGQNNDVEVFYPKGGIGEAISFIFTPKDIKRDYYAALLINVSKTASEDKAHPAWEMQYLYPIGKWDDDNFDMPPGTGTVPPPPAPEKKGWSFWNWLLLIVLLGLIVLAILKGKQWMNKDSGSQGATRLIEEGRDLENSNYYELTTKKPRTLEEA